jgi:26S proteasome regulatory subunit N3
VRATQLDYTDAFSKLNQAVRKAPADEGRAALGFRREVTKLLVIVQLLLGDIPERATFDQPALRRSLQPYLALTTAVRLGDLLEFEKTVTAHAAMFKKDKTHTLILRLGHNVIKTGLRKISLSYSRISLAEIAGKLHLGRAGRRGRGRAGGSAVGKTPSCLLFCLTSSRWPLIPGRAAPIFTVD